MMSRIPSTVSFAPMPSGKRSSTGTIRGGSATMRSCPLSFETSFEHAGFGGLQHPLPIAARGGQVVRPALLVGETAVASRDLHACDQPLEVPLERPGVRFVEVVDVEHQV